MSGSGNFSSRPGRPLETLGDPKHCLKILFLLKRSVPHVTLCQFLCTWLVFTRFARCFIDFSLEIDEKTMKKTMWFFAAALVVFNMATLTKHCILQYESYFFIFRVFAFFLKKNSRKAFQNRDHVFSFKNHSKVVPGSVLGPKTVPN